MPYFHTEDGCRLYYELTSEEATKPALVFLNGTIQNTVHWTHQARHFRQYFRVLQYDARAQGRSDLGTSPLSIDVHVADLAALMRYLNVVKASLVGLSHGARVAIEMATRQPRQISRLVLCSVTTNQNKRTRESLTRWRNNLAARGLEATAWAMLPEVMGETYLDRNRKLLPKVVKAIVTRNRPESLLAHFDAMLAYPPPSKPDVINTLPVLVISGEQDSIVSPEDARRLADLMGGKHVLFTGVGHALQLEAPERFNHELDAFLSSNSQ